MLRSFWPKKKKHPAEGEVDGLLADGVDASGKKIKYSLKERQDWNVVLGEPPASKREYEEVFVVPSIDRRELDEDRIFTNTMAKIAKVVAPTMLFLPCHYKLQYTFPGAPLTINVFLDELKVRSNEIIETYCPTTFTSDHRTNVLQLLKCYYPVRRPAGQDASALNAQPSHMDKVLMMSGFASACAAALNRQALHASRAPPTPTPTPPPSLFRKTAGWPNFTARGSLQHSFGHCLTKSMVFRMLISVLLLLLFDCQLCPTATALATEGETQGRGGLATIDPELEQMTETHLLEKPTTTCQEKIFPITTGHEQEDGEPGKRQGPSTADGVKSRSKRGAASTGSARKEKGMYCGFSSSSSASPTGLGSEGLNDTFVRNHELPGVSFFDCSDADFGSKPDVMIGDLVAFDGTSLDHLSWFACPAPTETATISECSTESRDRFSPLDIVLVVRGGGCSFARKVFEAQCLGAGAVVVADLSSAAGEISEFRMGSSEIDTFVRSIKIPSVFVAEPVASVLVQALKDRHREGSSPVEFILTTSYSAVSSLKVLRGLSSCQRKRGSFWLCGLVSFFNRCKNLTVSLLSNRAPLAGGLLLSTLVSALALCNPRQRNHIFATIIGLSSILLFGILLRSEPTLRPGHPAADSFDDVTSQLMFDGYDHAEADERVLRLLSLGARAAHRKIINPRLWGHQYLSNYHLQEPSWLSSPLPNDTPSYQLLGLAKQNYDRVLFHHPPLFVLGSVVWEEVFGLEYPLYPVALSLSIPLLIVLLGVSSLRLSHSSMLWATLSALFCPTAAFCGQKYWLDNMLPPFIFLSLLMAISGHDAAANNRREYVIYQRFACSGFFLGMGLLVKVTALGAFPSLIFCCLAVGVRSGVWRFFLSLVSLMFPICAIYSWWLLHFFRVSDSFDVLSAMWPSQELIEVGGTSGNSFLGEARDRPFYFYFIVLAKLWPIVILAIGSLWPSNSDKSDSTATKKERNDIQLSPRRVSIISMWICVLSYLVAFTGVGIKGGLYQTRHILPCLPFLAVLIGIGVDGVLSTGYGLWGHTTTILLAVGGINTFYAVVFAAPLSADLVIGLWEVTMSMSRSAPLPDLQMEETSVSTVKFARQILSHYALLPSSTK